MPEATSTRSGAGAARQRRVEQLQGQAVAPIAARDKGHRLRLVHDRLEKLARAVRPGLRRAGVRRQAVEQGDAVAAVAQRGGDGQQPQRLDPQVVGRKIIDPGVDEQNLSTGVHRPIIPPGAPAHKSDRLVLCPVHSMIQLTAMMTQAGTAPKVAAVVLAAGGASRMGELKQLLPVGGQPMVRRVTEAVCAAGLAQVVVVVGAEAEAVTEALTGLPVDVVANEAWAKGLSTLAAGGTGHAAARDPGRARRPGRPAGADARPAARAGGSLPSHGRAGRRARSTGGSGATRCSWIGRCSPSCWPWRATRAGGRCSGATQPKWSEWNWTIRQSRWTSIRRQDYQKLPESRENHEC